MLRSLSLLLLVCLPAVANTSVSRGTVIHRISGCDYFMVQNHSGYSVLEWFGGDDPDKDDVLIGDFSSFGMHTFRYADDDDNDKSSRLYVEDYGLSKTDALEKLVDECE